MRIRRVLIANRGEIAVRIIRSCERLGIETALAASEADLDSLPARLADQTICIGPAPATQSYLDVEAVVAASRSAAADAVHPGYGFLAESPRLARGCEQAGLIFIGPTVEQLDAVGDKLEARRHAMEAGLPVVPGGAVDSVAEATALSRETGWPLLLKAVGGGGGRGMKLVRKPAELRGTMELAIAEANAAFGDPRIYVERFVESGRHVEVQLLGDGERVIHLGERDCSVQRRYQKLIEEAPAPGLPQTLRSAMHAAAVDFGRHLNYRGLGTVEFLYDSARGEFYFLEMNARIQVEHPVTEAITGLDLVAEQIAVAEGRALGIAQSELRFAGHAIECRINAEDASRDFRPSPGRIRSARFPAGPDIRVDTHIEPSARVPPFYDSLLAKLIVHGRDRTDALARLRNALAHCHIDGVATNVTLHALITHEPEFVRGGVGTSYLARLLERAPLAGAAHG